MAQVETALLPRSEETGDQRSATPAHDGVVASSDALTSCATEDALLHRRLRLLRMFLSQIDASARGDFEPLRRMEQEIEEQLDWDDEPLWHMVPLAQYFILHYTVRAERAWLLPRLLDVKAQVSQGSSRFASIKVRQWLALAALDAGQLRLAYQESLAALDLIEQMAGYTLLRGYFELVLACVLYHWNRLNEAQGLLQDLLHTAAAWQQLDLLGVCAVDLLRVALARREWPLAHQALQQMEHLVQRERFAYYPDALPMMRAEWWLACGQLRDAGAWAASTAFPEEPWDNRMYETFPVVVRVYLAQQRWQEAAERLERWRGHLDRPVPSVHTITYLAQLLVALHHTGKSEQARDVATRLFALTKPEGYVRVYLDEGEPMRQALQALLAPHPERRRPDASTTAYVSTLLTAFAQQEQDAHGPLKTAPSPAPVASSGFGAPGVTLTRREQDVLRLLAEGASNQDIARTLVIELSTVKKHVSNVLGKLGATNRTRAVSRARALSLL